MVARRTSCCGRGRGGEQPTERASPSAEEHVPAVASTHRNVRVIYLGGRNVHFRGMSGNWYHFGPSRRHGELAKRDLSEALARSDFMLEPDVEK